MGSDKTVDGGWEKNSTVLCDPASLTRANRLPFVMGWTHLASFFPKQLQLQVIACQNLFFSYLFKHLWVRKSWWKRKDTPLSSNYRWRKKRMHTDIRIGSGILFFSYSYVRTREWNRMLVVGILLHILKKKKSVHYLEFPSLLEHGSSHSLHRNYPSKEMHVLPGNQNSRGESVNSWVSQLVGLHLWS